MSEYIECECNDVHHVIRVDVFEEGLIICVQLRSVRFLKRIWYALKYIFGRQINWEETILGGDGTKKLKSLCDKFLNK